jgi:hypothetical protein
MALRRQAPGQMVPALFVENCPVSQEHCMRALTIEVSKDGAAIAGLIGDLEKSAGGAALVRDLSGLS